MKEWKQTKTNLLKFTESACHSSMQDLRDDVR